jgi:hypothetical protein
VREGYELSCNKLVLCFLLPEAFGVPCRIPGSSVSLPFLVPDLPLPFLESLTKYPWLTFGIRFSDPIDRIASGLGLVTRLLDSSAIAVRGL